ncbi:MAG: phosphonate ABC transporter, permease protein PhnE [Actinomycetota bacterium]
MTLLDESSVREAKVAAEVVSPGEGKGLTPPSTRRRNLLTAILVAFIGACLYSMWDIGVNPLTFWTERQDIFNLLDRMWAPRIDEPRLVWEAALDTFLMAFAGTALGIFLAIPIAFLSANNVTKNRVIRGVARAFIVVTRALPELILALIFVRVYSIGVLPGVLALGLHSIGMLGKLFSDSIEQIDPGPREGVIASGAGRFQEITTGILPQVIPSFIAISLYRLDINFRASTLLGLVGAGGIGLQIRAHQGSLDYEQLLGVTLVIIVLIAIVEIVSSKVRAVILGHDDGPKKKGVLATLGLGHKVQAEDFRPADPTTAELPFDRETLRPPWNRDRIVMWVFGGSCLAMLVLAFTVPDLSFIEMVQGLPEIPEIFNNLIPRNMDWWDDRWGELLIETVQMGFAATGLSLVFAIPTALLAARNVAPARWVYNLTRSFILGVRALPDLIVAVIFVAALGLGPQPGVLALAIGLYGFSTKLFADSIEEIKEGPRDGVRATGASGVQETFTSVLPQAMPSIIGHSLYVLDVSLRASTVLGIVGAGGIGFPLVQGTRLFQFELVGGLLICIFVLVYAIELLSTWVRKQVI